MSPRAPGKKQQAIEALFTQVQARGLKNLEFDNQFVKAVTATSFANQFDATKFDTSSLLPDSLRRQDYCVLHLGTGRHRFFRGLSLVYHAFEPVPEDRIIPWKYRRSILNLLDTSEASILSLISNQRILHDFLYEDIVASPKVYNSRRTKSSFSYLIKGETISVRNLQIEIDMHVELQGTIDVLEGKNGEAGDFNVFQLYHPFRYFKRMMEEGKLKETPVRAVYVNKLVEDGQIVVRLRQYRFTEETDPSSLELIKIAQYNLLER